MASRPEFILADKPTANFDSESTAHLLGLMQKRCEKEKQPSFFTHEQRVIEKARRAVVLKDGMLFSDTNNKKREVEKRCLLKSMIF